MGKGLPRSRARGSQAQKGIVRQTIQLKNVPMTINGASGVGWGTAVIGDFPEGNILFLGAVAYIGLTGPGSGVVAAFNGDYGIGSTPANDATITGGDVDLIPSTATIIAANRVAPVARGTHAVAVTGTVYDNTDGSLEINLNILIDDADISADGLVFLINGSLDIVYTVLGDD